MNSDDSLEAALRLPRGAVYRRCALQVNPSTYARNFRGSQDTVDPIAHANAIVREAWKTGVSVLAITDHNDASGFIAFRQVAKNYGITVLPGFELTSSEGVHVLCIYPQSTRDKELERYLGQFGIMEPGSSSELSSKSFSEILRDVRQHGGLTIAAHVTSDKGLLKVLKGNARAKAWQDPNLLAVQIPKNVKNLYRGYRSIVTNSDPKYLRERPTGASQGLAVVNARDVVEADDLRDPSATSLIKMSSVGIEGLRQAFLDPESRIQIENGDVISSHPEIVAITWVGGFLDGSAVHFNSNLNVLVGGRGTGKSTIVESLRYVLGLEPIGKDAATAHGGIVRDVIRAGSKISLLVRTFQPEKREYRIERIVPNPPVVRDAVSGEISRRNIEDLLPGAEVFGQHEISELAKDSSKLIRLLDRFVEKNESLVKRKSDLRRGLEKNRRSILEVESELDDIEERLSALAGLEETLEQFEQAGFEERLAERSLLVREENVLNQVPDRLQAFTECLEKLRQLHPIDRAFLSPKALDGLPSANLLGEANSIFDAVDESVAFVITKLSTALERAEANIESIASRWGVRKREVETEYQQILRELEGSAVAGEQFIRLRSQIESLRPLRGRQELLKKLQTEYLAERYSLLADWEEAKAESFRSMDTAARNVGEKLAGRVQVNIMASGDRHPLTSLLRNTVSGQLASALQRLEDLDSISLIEFAAACRIGADALRSQFHFSPSQSKKIADAGPELPMLIEELELPARMEIRLNTSPVNAIPNWQALDELSTGQRATAILLLLLLDSQSPLVIDQPEDDLDNAFIADGIVPRMREEKRRRQFIFATHNANIPVLGDAELIVGLVAGGDAKTGRAELPRNRMGSIDINSVRELIEDALEGGKLAFEVRRLKYGF